MRAVFNTVGSVLAATFGAPADPAAVLAAARRMVIALTADRIGEVTGPDAPQPSDITRPDAPPV
ncbi:hypothetical protein Acsp02_51280 [Actinoplanes sp. NBRC 103695]|nr:hypothetical protein Acsp02_51280 [Actinoplanes sp. NBRC 103695]